MNHDSLHLSARLPPRKCFSFARQAWRLEDWWRAGSSPAWTAAGETNKTASKVTKDPYTISDINATIAHLLGIEAEKERFSPTGRPFKVANKGEVIKDILA